MSLLDLRWRKKKPQPAPEPPLIEVVPLGAQPIRVTDERDGPFAQRMMAYWSNAWVSDGRAYVFAGHIPSGGPKFYEVDLQSLAVVTKVMMMPFGGETEGWSWGKDGDIYLTHGVQHVRANPFTGSVQELYQIGDEYPGCVLTQPHSSPSGLTHSATVLRPVNEGPYERIATVVFHNGQLHKFEAIGVLDESDVVGDDWVVIKETPFGAPVGNNDNRVIHLATRETRHIPDAARALGHSACGPTYMVGEADKPDPGALGVWDLTQPLTMDRFRLLVPTLNMGYVSVAADKILWSNDTHLSLVDRATGAVTVLLEHGANTFPGDPGYYDRRVKANLSPCGRAACYMVNGAVYLLVL